MSFLRRIEHGLDKRLRGIFGGSRDEPGAREAIELYRDALDQIAARATVGKRGDRVFPFDLITIELSAPDAERKAVLETLFEPGQMIEDVRAALLEERITPPHNLTVAVHYPEAAVVEMRIVCEKATQSSAVPQPSVPSALPPSQMRLITLTGISSSPDFVVDRPRVNIGREYEVVDGMGRAVRRNDLAFPENAHEANGSVSRSHAHIRYESASGEWRIYDDGSSLGTSIFRDGHRIDVPPHAPRGVMLRPGDEIYLGQAKVRFEALI